MLDISEVRGDRDELTRERDTHPLRWTAAAAGTGTGTPVKFGRILRHTRVGGFQTGRLADGCRIRGEEPLPLRKSQMKMKSAGAVDGGLFTESYCNICNAQLISESQRTAHYESKKHANKVRLFYMLHPEDGGPPSKRLRPDNPDCAETEVDRNKCCTLCNMFFTSAIVAQSHYQGKTHAKRVRLVLGEPPNLPTAMTSPTNTDSSPSTPLPTDPAACPPPPPDLPWPMAVVGGNGGREAGKYCCLCGAWFNNPLMAQQHYEGKKHRRNAARARLLEQLAGSLDATETTGLRSSYSCSVCSVVLNSIEQYHAHVPWLQAPEQPKATPAVSRRDRALWKEEEAELIGINNFDKDYLREKLKIMKKSCGGTSVRASISVRVYRC
ncbi:hypothetical protein Q5P01_021473 [Channa striata]|uniref:Zinc finger matrin-type protein 4 n=1 Tax=Channa striata TaxID=64152 RepID=A0AA88LUQ1_CHASR|nr:hypothetical protein Q5P01_021473 [Channa striata]